MSIRTSPWPAGVPCWADLMATDVRAASAFYSGVLGWTVPEPDEQWGGYVVAQVDDAATAGIGPVQDGARAAWTLYFATDDADATTAAVTAHGGAVLSAPTDVGPLGRTAILADPTGAAFGLWQAGQMIGAERVNEPGGLIWEDLRSTDPVAAQAFYRDVFALSLEPMPMGGEGYSTFAVAAGDPLGGIGPMTDEPEGTPSHWLVYFAVADADAAVAAAERAGGSVLAPAFDTEFGRMATLTDPDGALFWVIQTAPGAPSPDRSG